MQKKELLRFELTEEHVKLIAKLNFQVCVDTEYDDQYIPGINRKRPFGNSGATENVLEILGCHCDENGGYKKGDVDRAEDLLIELPLALEVVTHNQTFMPGVYEVDRCGTYHQYRMMCNYKALHGALEEVEETLCKTEEDRERLSRLREFCMNVSGDEPWEVIRYIEWGRGKHPFWDDALAIFERHKACRRKMDKRQDR